MISEESKKKYITGGGNRCPFCGSENIESGIIEFETDISAPVGCNECGKEWIDYYRLADVQEVA